MRGIAETSVCGGMRALAPGQLLEVREAGQADFGRAQQRGGPLTAAVGLVGLALSRRPDGVDLIAAAAVESWVRHWQTRVPDARVRSASSLDRRILELALQELGRTRRVKSVRF
jgi:hypothetical protein